MNNLKYISTGILALCISAASLAQTTEQGRGTYDDNCARCHGGDARGGEFAPVSILDRISMRTDAELAMHIRTGLPEKGMPAFVFEDQDINRLIGYLRALVPVMSPGPPVVDRRSLRTTTGETLAGIVLNEGFTDVQLRSDSGSIHLLRKTGDKSIYREVTSQQDWPTYHGQPGGNRYTGMTQINKDNISRLAPLWTFPTDNALWPETTPLVHDGIMYISSRNQVWAVDAGTGRQIWNYRRPYTPGISGLAGLGMNRGVALKGNRVFLLTDHAHVIALDRSDGSLLWDTEMADYRQNYDSTAAPMVVGDVVIAGTGGGDAGVRGFVAGFDVATGEEIWRFWTVPLPGEPGSETWIGDAIEHGAGATWMSGTWDPELNILYMPTGNPGPDYDGDDRQGDNLYTDCILALNPETGELLWYYQFTPHDIHDWDAQEPPVLIDTMWQGKQRKLLIQANRNGFFYVLDRTDGELLLAKQFLKKLNWAEGIGTDGRPILKPLPMIATGETYVCPGFSGGTNWYSTSYNPGTGLYYFQALERCNLFAKRKETWRAGATYMAGTARSVPNEEYVKSLRALDIRTGEIAWDLPQPNSGNSGSGVLSTAAGLVFFGENSGYFVAVDAASGEVLWQHPTNQTFKASPMTYMFDHRQYIVIAAGTVITAFGIVE